MDKEKQEDGDPEVLVEEALTETEKQNGNSE